MLYTVTHFSSNLTGGAGVAARRLHEALVKIGVNSRLIEGGVSGVTGEGANRVYPLWKRFAQSVQISLEHRRWAPSCFFTSPRWWPRTPIHKLTNYADIINLHLVIRWLDLPTFFGSLRPMQPVVWSLHDLNPVTGGCHHPLECMRYEEHCCYCPMLRRSGSKDHSYQNFKLKDRLYQGLNLHLVGNSEWTTNQARKSALARHAKSIQTIYLGVNTEEFVPIEKTTAKAALRLGAEPFVVGFGCAEVSNLNKGGMVLLDAIKMLAGKHRIKLSVFGSGKINLNGEQINVVELGPLSSTRIQSIFYSACDVFVVPSRIESLGLTALEAMSCGTPVLAFKTGGLAEIVVSGQTGILEPDIGSPRELARHIEWFIRHPQETRQMGLLARGRVVNQYNAGIMAQRYNKLYEKVLNAQNL